MVKLVSRKEESLENQSDGKSKAVMGYIDSLRPSDHWNGTQLKRFYNEMDKALTLSSANKMLRHIGYQFKKNPGIYDTIDNMTSKV